MAKSGNVMSAVNFIFTDSSQNPSINHSSQRATCRGTRI